VNIENSSLVNANQLGHYSMCHFLWYFLYKLCVLGVIHCCVSAPFFDLLLHFNAGMCYKYGVRRPKLDDS